MREARLAHLKLKLVAGEGGLETREVFNPRIQKPGLALAGYLPYIKAGRLQILGESEYAYLETLGEAVATERLRSIVELEVPCLISTKSNQPPAEVVDACNRHDVPLLATNANTAETIELISAFLEDELAPRIQMHGVLLDVFSLGTLIVGDAGIGKSECALELVHRGHRLVADDLVMVRRTHNRGLLGTPHELLHNYLELRGVGIIDIRKHFGMTATQPSVTISLVIQLIKLSSGAKALEQRWREQMMERPRAWTSTETILGLEVPKYTMVVAPGRDVAIMVETAVRKCLLAQRGIQDERDFLEAVNRLAQGDPDG
jgi:HPr kinase/phosphorylase